MTAVLDNRWGLTIVSWDTLAGLVAGGVVAVAQPSGSAVRQLALTAMAGGVALVAVLATVLTLLGLLLDADALAPLVERLGGRSDVVFPYWFHGYLAATTLTLGIAGAATRGVVAMWIVVAAMTCLTWGAFGMVDLGRQALNLGHHRRRLESAATQARRHVS